MEITQRYNKFENIKNKIDYQSIMTEIINRSYYDVYKKPTFKRKRKKEQRSGGIILSNDLKKIILVLNRESVLNGDPKWGLPKGHIKYNESYSACAIREIEEETGLKLKIDNNTYSIKINDTLYYIFVVDETNNIPKPLDVFEIKDSKWIYLSDLDIFSCNRGLKKLHNSYKDRVINLAKNTIIDDD